jgi:mutator protein MutT
MSWNVPIFPPFPLLEYRLAMDRKDVVIAIIVRDGKLLICQRKADDAFGGYWEFPGGKREQGETLQQCLAREMMEELALKVQPLEALPPIEHDYPTIRVRLVPYLCVSEDEPRPIACTKFAWVLPGDLSKYQFPEANAPLLAQIIERFNRGGEWGIWKIGLPK